MNVENSSYVKTRHFTYIGVFLRDDTGQVAKKNLAYHFFKTFEYSTKADYLILKRNLGGNMNKDDFKDMVDFRAKEYNEARLINCDELNKAHKGLGDQFKDIYIEGLKKRIIGYASSNSKLISQGELMIRSWKAYFGKHSEAIMKSLKN